MSDTSNSDSDDLQIRAATAGRSTAQGKRQQQHHVRHHQQQQQQQQQRKRKRTGGKQFEVARTWETLVEGADGTIKSTVEGLLEAGKRKRLLRDTTPLQRGIIRHVILVIDLSLAMAEKDLRPTRYLLTLRYASEFVLEFFEQNPISQLGMIGMRDGRALRISDLSGNPTQHLLALHELRAQDPRDMPSLQNALEMARGMLFHTPSHGTREVIIIFGSLCSSDPGDIHETISHLITDKIRVSIVGLAAQVAVCREICARTNNDVSTDGRADDISDGGGYYGVVIDEVHFRELLMAITTPPSQRRKNVGGNGDGYLADQHASLLNKGRKGSMTGVTPAARGVKGISPSSRYECTVCRNHFCIDCDVFAHEVVHNCPGCQSTDVSRHLEEREREGEEEDEEEEEEEEEEENMRRLKD
ncbi:General transcription factor IIH subunit 2 [Ascosphaera aggregata]|nr:General transcription factor IIH subunit 2 [Ascosphaera aggregata]